MMLSKWPGFSFQENKFCKGKTGTGSNHSKRSSIEKSPNGQDS